MAEKASVSLRTVSDYEACKGNPEMTSLFLIARALHMSLDDCVFGVLLRMVGNTYSRLTKYRFHLLSL